MGISRSTASSIVLSAKYKLSVSICNNSVFVINEMVKEVIVELQDSKFGHLIDGNSHLERSMYCNSRFLTHYFICITNFHEVF